MSLWSRVSNSFHANRLQRELDEEIESHIAEAIEHGRDPAEARRAFGSLLRTREQSRDAKILIWLESLASDAVYGIRQLRKNRVASVAAILSLALAVGACTSAFRLIDAMLLRPLPIADANSFYVLTYTVVEDGKSITNDSFDYPQFRQLRDAVSSEADLLAISYGAQNGLTYGSDYEIEKINRQFVSGTTLGLFGLKPSAGRLLTASDDLKPGAHPYAVISYDYWKRRFGRDPKAIGRTFRLGAESYQIVGVLPEGFTGTETGTMTDVFMPTMANSRAIGNEHWAWFRTWVKLKPGVSPDRVREKLAAVSGAIRTERVKNWPPGTPPDRIQSYINMPLTLESAASGVSGPKREYKRSLGILGVIVALVLLISCANVANLMLAQAAARAREMALRVSIGAGRFRLIQMLVVESAMLAVAATLAGGLFAWWSAPLVVSMINPPDNPVRLVLPADWRVLGFSGALAIGVTLLFGLVPALRASAVKPISALRGGEDPHSRRRLMNGLVAAQVAFCFLVHFVAGLFVATFDRLSHQPVGFSTKGLIAIQTVIQGGAALPRWEAVRQRLSDAKGVEAASMCGFPLMSGNAWSEDVWVNGRPPDASTAPYFLSVSPRWLETMQIGLIDGQDFRSEDSYPKVAMVNEAFVRRYFDGSSPIGKSLETQSRKKRNRLEIVGYVRDARYRDLREPVRPTVYVPINWTEANFAGTEEQKLDWATFMVRLSRPDEPGSIERLRDTIRVEPGFRAANINTQEELVRQHTIRERLLATLSLFFAIVALILASVGLYGVLTYSVLQRRREIGIRMALGAPAAEVARRVTAEVFSMLLLGAVAGIAAGAFSERYLEKLLYGVRGTDVTMLALPVATIFAAAALAAIPPVIHAVRIDPASMLRTD